MMMMMSKPFHSCDSSPTNSTSTSSGAPRRGSRSPSDAGAVAAMKKANAFFAASDLQFPSLESTDESLALTTSSSRGHRLSRSTKERKDNAWRSSSQFDIVTASQTSTFTAKSSSTSTRCTGSRPVPVNPRHRALMNHAEQDHSESDMDAEYLRKYFDNKTWGLYVLIRSYRMKQEDYKEREGQMTAQFAAPARRHLPNPEPFGNTDRSGLYPQEPTSSDLDSRAMELSPNHGMIFGLDDEED